MIKWIVVIGILLALVAYVLMNFEIHRRYQDFQLFLNDEICRTCQVYKSGSSYVLVIPTEASLYLLENKNKSVTILNPRDIRVFNYFLFIRKDMLAGVSLIDQVKNEGGELKWDSDKLEFSFGQNNTSKCRIVF